MESNVKLFPIKDNRIVTWAVKYGSYMKTRGEAAANRFLIRVVPAQLRPSVKATYEVMRRTKRKNQ